MNDKGFLMKEPCGHFLQNNGKTDEIEHNNLLASLKFNPKRSAKLQHCVFVEVRLFHHFYKFAVKMSHTILLIHPTSKSESRTYTHYETKDECMEAVCKIFEEYLKKAAQVPRSITYDIANLSCLVRCSKEPFYEPPNKD